MNKFVLEVIQMNDIVSMIVGFGMVATSIWMFRYMDRSLKMHTEFDATISNIVQKIRVLQVCVYEDNSEVVDILSKQGVVESICKVLAKADKMGFSIYAIVALFNMKLTKRDSYRWTVINGELGFVRNNKNPILFGKLKDLQNKGLI